jgi:hypothetical protein
LDDLEEIVLVSKLFLPLTLPSDQTSVMRNFLIVLVSVIYSSIWSQELTLNSTFPKIEIVEIDEDEQPNFVKYAQFQIEVPLTKDKKTGLHLVKTPEQHAKRVLSFIEKGIQNKVNVLIFPELTSSLPEKQREQLEQNALQLAKKHDLFIILGSYYDRENNSRILVISSQGIYRSYKIKASRFEASPIKGQGMNLGETLLVFQTKYGNILPITCVDLISDDVQYIARYLSNNEVIEVLANINWNPATWEFMREVSSMVNRHPMFASITNNAVDSTKVKGWKSNPYSSKCDFSGYGDYGNTSLFGSLRDDQRDKLLPYISECFKHPEKDELLASYQNLIYNVDPGAEAMLVYDLNLRVIRLPSKTQAPDQGYPLVRNIEVIPLD